MIIEKAIAAALEPIVDDVIRIDKRIDAILDKVVLAPPKGDKGDKGDAADVLEVALALKTDAAFCDAVRGKSGIHGIDGAGIDAPIWIEGEVYRQGVTVIANIGQHFRALRDTAAPTDDGQHWQRIGTQGFRHRGAFCADVTYAEGDLFTDGYATFCIVRGSPVLLAGRGAIGKQGEPGKRGAPGKDGKNGGTIIASQVEGLKLILVQENADGSIDHIEADFTPALREMVRDAVNELRDEVTQ